MNNNSATIRFCFQCGAGIEAGSNFCGACGTAIRPPQHAPKVGERRAGIIPSVEASDGTPGSAENASPTLWRHPAIYFTAYMLALIPTYVLPYFGSNSLLANSVSATIDSGFSTAFWLHCIALYLLIAIAWLRGAVIGRSWLPSLPAIAALFDLMPGLNWMPLAPTIFHIAALMAGVTKIANSADTKNRNKLVIAIGGLFLLGIVAFYRPTDTNDMVAGGVVGNTQNIMLAGVWALAETGCGTDYGVEYASDGRFSEGDATGGVEGRWRVEGDELIRETQLEYQSDDLENPELGGIKSTKVDRSTRFHITRLNREELAFQDNGKSFSYVRCPEGHIYFHGGDVVQGT